VLFYISLLKDLLYVIFNLANGGGGMELTDLLDILYYFEIIDIDDYIEIIKGVEALRKEQF
jgi:hypothetical protein